MGDEPGPARLLVVEDERALRALLATFLRSAGFACSEAESVEEAIALLETEAIDIVLSDVNLRTGSGVDLVVWLRREQPRTAVVLVSGDTLDVTALAARAGAHGWLAKPFTRREVLETVARAQMRARAGS
jgi:DNA-binding response OmpR family regulator